MNRLMNIQRRNWNILCQLKRTNPRIFSSYNSSSISRVGGRSRSTRTYRLFSTQDPIQEDISLKKLIRPFLMKFHPDRQSIGNSSSNTELARSVNQKAIQAVNGLVDTVDAIVTRACEPSKHKIKGRLDLQKLYTIEFLVHSDEGKVGIKKPKELPIASRRSVDLIFTNRDIDSVNLVDANGKYSVENAIHLKVKAMREISKLLRVSGLNVPMNLQSQMKKLSEDSRTSIQASILHDELGLGGDGQSGKFGSTKPKSEFERSKQRFMESVDWNKYNKLYDEAVIDMDKDIATEGLIAMSKERKSRLVSEVVSRVRVFDASKDSISNSEHYEVNGLDPLHQLIAIRRLSLLLMDNFDELEMEDMGKLYETIQIVLTPERKTKETISVPYSRVRRLRKGIESGFKFSYISDDAVVVYVPIDFKDDEFIQEMKSHLGDFFTLCLSKGGMDDFLPQYYSEFRGQSNIE